MLVGFRVYSICFFICQQCYYIPRCLPFALEYVSIYVYWKKGPYSLWRQRLICRHPRKRLRNRRHRNPLHSFLHRRDVSEISWESSGGFASGLTESTRMFFASLNTRIATCQATFHHFLMPNIWLKNYLK